jgi:hypothetical protein
MAIGALIPIPRWQINIGSAPVPGAKLYTWLSGTSTPQAVYSDSGLTTARTIPVEADANGLFPIMYLAPVAYRIEVTTAAGVSVIPQTDNIYDFAEVQLAGSGGAALIGYLPGGSGAQATTVQAKLRQTRSVFDWYTAAQQADVLSGALSLDLTAATQTAITAMIAMPGELFFPAGNYSLGALTLVGSNVTLKGAGGGATKWVTRAGTDADLLTIGSAAAFLGANTVEAIEMRGNSANNSAGCGIRIHGVILTRINNCPITDFVDGGVIKDGTGGFPSAYTTIRDCYIHTNLGPGIQSLANSYGLVVTTGTVIAGNGKTPAGGAGILLEAGDTHRIIGVLFDENEEGIHYESISDAVIANCVFENQDRTSIASTGAASIGVTISNNQILNSGLESAGTYDGIQVNGTAMTVTGNGIRNASGTMSACIREAVGANGNVITDNPVANATTLIVKVGATTLVRDNPGYVTEQYGATSVADGGTITHGLATTPTSVIVTPSLASTVLGVTALGATTFTVAVKNDSGGAGTTQTVYWNAKV